MNKIKIMLCVLFFILQSNVYAQVEIIEGIPSDLENEKLIFLQHEPIDLKSDEGTEASKEYVLLRQENHNDVSKQFNSKLEIEVKSYAYQYIISNPSEYENLNNKEYKYVLDSEVYKYTHLKGQPEEDELIVFEYYIREISSNKLYKVFELDEMKVYDAKLIVKRLNKAIERSKKIN